MDLNIILWVLGTLFSLGIFAVKVGFGLGFGRFGIKGIAVTLAGYTLLFVAIALLSDRIMEMAMPVLQKGPYIHLLMAAGMIVWGFYMLRGGHGTDHAFTSIGTGALKPSLLLVVPCPVCLSAMSFSCWTALGALRMPPALVGLGLGVSFATLAVVFLVLSRSGKTTHPDASLGLAMVAIGAYFIGSLFLPARIEEARTTYASFGGSGVPADPADMAGVLLILFAALAMGYLLRQKGDKQ